MAGDSANLWEAAFEHAPCFIAILDQHYRIVRANRRFSSLFGPGDGEPCYGSIKGGDGPCAACVAAAAFADGEEHRGEGLGTSQDGNPVTFRVRAVPVQGDCDGPECVLLLGEETTELTNLRVELEQADRLAAVGLSTAGLAHSIKSILGGLEGATYTVSSGLERRDDERVQLGWELVQKYTEQVATLVRGLLSYAKDPDARRQSTAPDSLVNEVVELYASKAGMLDVELRGEVEASLGPVLLDPKAIAATLANLVANALDACTWDPDHDQAHEVRVRAKARPGGGVIFEVEDNGMGIAEENQAKILAAMFTTKGMRGTGLGLLLSKKAVEAHGGQMTFTTMPGEGTTFTFDIPAS